MDPDEQVSDSRVLLRVPLSLGGVQGIATLVVAWPAESSDAIIRGGPAIDPASLGRVARREGRAALRGCRGRSAGSAAKRTPPRRSAASDWPPWPGSSLQKVR